MTPRQTLALLLLVGGLAYLVMTGFELAWAVHAWMQWRVQAPEFEVALRVPMLQSLVAIVLTLVVIVARAPISRLLLPATPVGATGPRPWLEVGVICVGLPGLVRMASESIAVSVITAGMAGEEADWWSQETMLVRGAAVLLLLLLPRLARSMVALREPESADVA